MDGEVAAVAKYDRVAVFGFAVWIRVGVPSQTAQVMSSGNGLSS